MATIRVLAVQEVNTPLRKTDIKLESSLGQEEVEIQPQYVGLSGADLEMLGNDLGFFSYPLTPGRQVIGIIKDVGASVSGFQKGQRVAVGPVAYSCLSSDCLQCSSGYDHLCPHAVYTSLGKFPYTDIVNLPMVQQSQGQSQSQHSQPKSQPSQSQSQRLSESIKVGRHYEVMEHHKECRPFASLAGDGRHFGGFTNSLRVHEHWVFPFPKDLDPKVAPGLLFNGATVYSALKYGKKIFGSDEQLKVAVAGLGTTGHLAVLYAKAMDLHVTALRRSQDPFAYKALGADAELITDNDADRRKALETFDLVLLCSYTPEDMLDGYLKLLRRHGSLIIISLSDRPMSFHPLRFVLHTWRLMGVYAASKGDTQEALDLAVARNIQPKASLYDIDNVEQALRDLRSGELYGATIEITDGFFNK